MIPTYLTPDCLERFSVLINHDRFDDQFYEFQLTECSISNVRHCIDIYKDITGKNPEVVILPFSIYYIELPDWMDNRLIYLYEVLGISRKAYITTKLSKSESLKIKAV